MKIFSLICYTILIFFSLNVLGKSIKVESTKQEKELLKKKIIAFGTDRTIPFGIKVTANDYVSFPPYYWENPISKDSPYIVIDCKKNQKLVALGSTDRKVTFFRMIYALNKAYERTGDKKYARRAGAWLKAWWITPKTRMNPSLRFAQIRPIHDKEGRGGGIIDWHDFPAFLFEIEKLKQRDALRKSEWVKVDQWLSSYDQWLETSKQGIDASKRHNNHQTYYLAQRAAINGYLGRTEKAHDIIKKAFDSIDLFIAPNGAQPHELKRPNGFSYSVFTLKAWFMLNRLSLKYGGIDYRKVTSPKGASITKALKFIEDACNDPNQTIFKDKINIRNLDGFKK